MGGGGGGGRNILCHIVAAGSSMCRRRCRNKRSCTGKHYLDSAYQYNFSCSGIGDDTCSIPPPLCGREYFFPPPPPPPFTQIPPFPSNNIDNEKSGGGEK